MHFLTKLSKHEKKIIIKTERKKLIAEIKSSKSKPATHKVNPRVKQLAARLLARKKLPITRPPEVIALDLIDRASLFSTMMKETRSATEVARRTVYSQQHVRIMIEALTLPTTVQAWIRNRWLSAESGFVLARLDHPIRNRALRQVEPFMSLREVKRMVQSVLGSDAPMALSIKGERANASMGKRVVWRGQRKKREETIRLCQAVLDKQSIFTDYQRGRLASLFWDMGLLGDLRGRMPPLSKLRKLATLIRPPDK